MRLRGRAHFCSAEHQRAYQKEMDRMALESLRLQAPKPDPAPAGFLDEGLCAQAPRPFRMRHAAVDAPAYNVESMWPELPNYSAVLLVTAAFERASQIAVGTAEAVRTIPPQEIISAGVSAIPTHAPLLDPSGRRGATVDFCLSGNHSVAPGLRTIIPEQEIITAGASAIPPLAYTGRQEAIAICPLESTYSLTAMPGRIDRRGVLVEFCLGEHPAVAPALSTLVTYLTEANLVEYPRCVAALRELPPHCTGPTAMEMGRFAAQVAPQYPFGLTTGTAGLVSYAGRTRAVAPKGTPPEFPLAAVVACLEPHAPEWNDTKPTFGMNIGALYPLERCVPLPDGRGSEGVAGSEDIQTTALLPTAPHYYLVRTTELPTAVILNMDIPGENLRTLPVITKLGGYSAEDMNPLVMTPPVHWRISSWSKTQPLWGHTRGVSNVGLLGAHPGSPRMIGSAPRSATWFAGAADWSILTQRLHRESKPIPRALARRNPIAETGTGEELRFLVHRLRPAADGVFVPQLRQPPLRPRVSLGPAPSIRNHVVSIADLRTPQAVWL
ncbi:MAG: hypothetical protein HY820_34190 [Acidobacteria bacterium]|nr:hypothetical protein [Acidobacteriota bacterium]